ncbi:ribose transport system permease protein RbsC [Clostridium homopropionicum DSM 5847]|uniref:Ribose transport system permease protein RbsC n=1 Tax=Clostridium homopropionicum DSM 5847 TaxID=1121318 RepID=A0A0L6Z8L7_9CLOT|nr:ABC transporter permease [Clostridium homopropionicum]KOA19143.1 ribose transport system permease protein RbsC [Clostridium homopropionicum DSM 5847]SFG15482.1 monosaccharide ABC transporter membrane protein, CUT2 family [Clostridium homopropionicum]
MENTGVRNERFSTTDNEKSLKKVLGKFGPLLGLILLCVALSIASPDFLSVKNIMNIARQSAINSIIAAGMLLTILTAGIDLSVGSILALATCVMAVAVKAGLSPALAIILCIGTGAALGLVNGLLLTKLRLPHPFISTLGTKNIARGLALMITAASPISGFSSSITFLGAEFLGPIPVSFLLVIVVCVLFHIFLNRTAQGRHIYAVGSNPEAARLSGVNVQKTLILVYTLCGTMAGIAGLVLVGRVNAAFPLAGLDFDLDAIAACIIGGASFMGGSGTIWGTLIGAMIISVLRNGLNLLGVSADLQTVSIGLVIIGAVYVDVLRRRAEKKAK